MTVLPSPGGYFPRVSASTWVRKKQAPVRSKEPLEAVWHRFVRSIAGDSETVCGLAICRPIERTDEKPKENICRLCGEESTT